MKAHLYLQLLFRVVAFALMLNTQAADLGIPAPSLRISQWVRGDSIDTRPGMGTNLQVLVFWETGCHACSDSIPQLTELQKKYRSQGLVLIAISCEPGRVIKAFVATMEDKIDFTVAADDARKTYDAYMGAFNESVFPHAFVIGKTGTIVWHRNPMAGLAQAIEEMMTGKFDIESEKRAVNAEKLQRQYFSLARTNSADPKAVLVGRQIITDGAANPWLLNNFAWNILTGPAIKRRDLDLALKAVKAAYAAGGGTNAAFADTYAHALFEAGQTEQAIQMQKRALEFNTAPRDRALLQETLKKYEEKARGSSP
jgi:peroxiredoxin